MIESEKHSYMMLVNSGDTKKLYAYIPSKMGPVAQEIHFQIPGEEILVDDFVKAKLAIIASPDQSIFNKKNAYKEIKQYLSFQEENGRLNADSALDIIDESINRMPILRHNTSDN
jgi:hypothetical protein